MTPVDQRLDSNLVLGPNPLHVYRLTRRKYSVLSGVGASLAPGRWNQLGEEAIYTSLEQAGTVLECLAHTPKNKIPSDLVMIKITIRGRWLRGPKVTFEGQTLEARVVDEDSSADMVAIPTLREAQAFVPDEEEAFAIAVPSVILPIWNIVLYPQRHGFWTHVSISQIESFSYDPRHFPEAATIEP